MVNERKPAGAGELNTLPVATMVMMPVSMVMPVATIFSMVGSRSVVPVAAVMAILSFILWPAVTIAVAIPIIPIVHHTSGQKYAQKANY